ncbi:threonine-phosphate decarboxylase CobD [Methanocella arvoryzae]|uniref:threonine-phosphate decarboxylase n=1 Tax=Methanocella arvoryzae (strain DSM 22066 / NBRC 105507 / MRE50) TaxID=351160 RepID=Q0W1P3_METAR|nr:threonine-phosphate decarboxylase CobD [Methanocella arvoryzae]CAJ37700.1 putative L-threonine-O-3-phosphate decarboxylase [Methanocella arvoryzae MRE50]
MFVRKELQQLMPCAHGGRLREIAEQKGLKEKEILDFSVNVNPYLPLDPKEIVSDALSRVAEYPDNRYNQFRESAARFTGVKKENIVPGNGSTEIIRLFAEAAITKGDIIAVPCPTFGEYEQQCRLFGAHMRYVKFSYLLDREYWHLNGSKAVFICNPNNPDGRLLSKEHVLEIVDYCKGKGILTVVDEAFIDLADPCQSVSRLVEKYENLLVMRSLTKCFAIPGFRLGFGIVNSKDAELLNMVRLTWNVDSVAAEVGAHYMDVAGPYLDVSRAYMRRERERLFEGISAIKGLRALPASANYFLLDVGGLGMTATEFTGKMLDQKILVRDCASFKMLGDTYVRLAVRTHEENEQLLKALKTVAESS